MYTPLLSTIVVAIGLATSTVSAIPKITVKGSKFFTDDGNQFYIKGTLIPTGSIRSVVPQSQADFALGIAYQLTPDDPLINTEQCKLDASLMKDLGANTIRVYHVEPNEDHEGCMKAFADNGIYLFVDLDTFNTQINYVSRAGDHA